MKILLVTCFFPPYNAIGSVRTGKFARYFRQHGHEVRVLTARDLPLLTNMKEEIPAEFVTATRWFNLNAIPEMLFGGRKQIVQTGYKIKSGSVKRLGFYYRALLHYPDEMTGWQPFAVSAGKKIIQEWKPDLIYTSGKPFTAFLVAKKLSEWSGIPWVAEMRDLWMDNHDYPYPDWRRKREMKLEKTVLSTAKALVTVSVPWAEAIGKKYQKPAAVVYNGFDPADYPALEDLAQPQPDHLRIVYTGTFYPAFQDCSPLLEALALMGPEREKISVEFYTRYLDVILNRAKELGVDHLIQQKSFIPYRQALQSQMEADLVLLFLWAKKEESEQIGNYPAKLFEYLGARRPILGLGLGEDLPTKLIRERQAGFVSNQPEEIAAQLRSWLAQKQKDGRIPFISDEARRGFSRDEQFAVLEKFLEGQLQTTKLESGL
jgi:glycosyltransferase involved in cell wall biosynthesis